MAKFEEAYFKSVNEYLDVKSYENNIHYGKIYCPECHEAPLHIVKKQKIPPYFASNSQQEHSEDCQHYQEFISKNNLKRLLESNSIEDRDRLKFLIDNNLTGAINLLLKNKPIERNSNHLSDIKSPQSSSQQTGAYKKESIPRVSIKNILKNRNTFLENYLVVWGESEIESEVRHPISSITNKPFIVKNLIFRINGSFRFSVSLSESKIKHYKELPEQGFKTGFAIFGLLVERNGYLEIKIATTKHLKYL